MLERMKPETKEADFREAKKAENSNKNRRQDILPGMVLEINILPFSETVLNCQSH
jgi:hypothetical protein